MLTVVKRPFKSFGSNFTVVAMQMVLLLDAICCLGFNQFIGDKSLYSKEFTFFMSDIAWILMGVTLGGISLTGLVLVIFGWFKASRFFYMQRFGIKKAPLVKAKPAPFIKTATNPLEFQSLTGRYQGVTSPDQLILETEDNIGNFDKDPAYDVFPIKLTVCRLLKAKK
jgi:hypothetical protein